MRTIHAQRRLILLFAILLCFALAGCSKAAAKSGTVTVTTATAAKLALPEDHGTLGGIAVSGDSVLVVTAEEDGFAVAAFDTEGTLLCQAGLEEAWGENAVLYGVGGSADGFAVLLYEDGYTLARYDVAGALEGTIRLEGPEAAAWGPILTEEGETLLWNPEALFIFDETGALRCSTAMSGSLELITVVNSGDGCFAVVQNGGEAGVCPVDLETGGLGEFSPLDRGMACYTRVSGLETGALINTGDALYTYDGEKFEILFNWQEALLDGTAAVSVAALDEDLYACMTEDAVSLIQTGRHEVERTFLTVGAIGSRNSRLEALVNTFNRSNKAYYAETKYYDDTLQFTTELMAGKGPDIMEVSYSVWDGGMTIPLTGTYFEDLGPYLDSDPTISRSDLVENLLDALMVDGKLTSIPTAFYISTLDARTADVGPDSGWTMDDLMQLLEEKGEGYYAFPAWVTSEALFSWVPTVSLGEFVDWNAMTCDFENEGFISLLKLCKMLPSDSEYESDVAEYSDWDEHVLLTIEYIQSVTWLQQCKKNYGGDEITYIGYPNNSGNNGSFFVKPAEDLQLAICAQSKNKDAAWLLVRELFSDTCQDNTEGFPIVRAKLRAAIEPYINLKNGVLTQEDMDKFLQLVDETELFVSYGNSIRDILTSEVEPYFNDDKTAEEVAHLIQNRVQLYLDEQK